LKQFLEKTPPEIYEDISDLFKLQHNYWDISKDELLLHCDSEECNGLRLYRQQTNTVSVPSSGWARGFASYVCRNWTSP